MFAASALAHGDPPGLAFWGGFPSDAARCQRAIGAAAAACAADAIAAHGACLETGDGCAAEALDGLLREIRAGALERVERACGESELRALQFVDAADALADVIRGCREAETAAVTAIYGPVMGAGSVARADEDIAACTAAASREAAKLLRYALRSRRRALDRIAAANLALAEKEMLLARAEAGIRRARSLVRERLRRQCPDRKFVAAYGQTMDAFLGRLAGRADCLGAQVYVTSALGCPEPACGNGMQEAGEACDDGNGDDADACGNDCRARDCTAFDGTFDLIQSAVFERHGCTNALCHGEAASGGLDLRPGVSFERLIDVPSSASELVRVAPGEPERSLLWLKLAAKTYPDRYAAPLSPMPLGGAALGEAEIEALRVWIQEGAPRHGTVMGTAELLDACLPPPRPIEIRPPAPPAPGEGIQLHMPSYVLAPQSEREVCFSSYYDFTGRVPAGALSPDGRHIRFNRVVTTQNPQSHHMVVLPYKGDFAAYPPGDRVWGRYQCAGGARAGQSCDPLDLGSCGPGAECGTVPRQSPGCVGYGPPDAQFDIGSFGFAGAQEPVARSTYPPGAYGEIPLKAVVVWNSHAFNLTAEPGVVETWVNLYFAPAADQLHPVVDLADISEIFGMSVPAYESREVCNVHVFPPGTRLFELGSHTHKRGKRFRIFRGAFRCRGGERAGRACSPLSPETCPESACAEAKGRSASDSLLYTSFLYSDPVVLTLDPPLVLSGPEDELAFTYCALFDNGGADPAEVKRRSTSPVPPIAIGGPCAVPTHCVEGRVKAACDGFDQEARDRSCDSAPGSFDGFCDACPLGGGLTTEDEMFVLLGRYYVP